MNRLLIFCIRIKNMMIDILKCVQKMKFDRIIPVSKFHIRLIRIRHHLLKVIDAQYALSSSSNILINELNYDDFREYSKELSKQYGLKKLNFETINEFYKQRNIRNVI